MPRISTFYMNERNKARVLTPLVVAGSLLVGSSTPYNESAANKAQYAYLMQHQHDYTPVEFDRRLVQVARERSRIDRQF